MPFILIDDRRHAPLDSPTTLVLAAPPENIRQAALTQLPVAHMIYRIGRGYHLFRAQNAPVISGGMMVLDTDGYAGGGPMASLVSEILSECDKRGYTGIVLDIGSAASRPLSPLAGALGAETAKHGLALFVPQPLGAFTVDAGVLIPSALSGGTLHDHIADALRQYGDGRVALEMERIRMDFILPAASGTGKSLSADELQALMEQHHAKSFYSKDLCAFYFSYRDRKGTHFVLYDTAVSIRRKLQVAGSLGIKYAFAYYPHVADILSDIIA
jgi:hypothetical protein